MAKQLNQQLWAPCCVTMIVLMFAECILASPDPLKCEGIKCPPLSDLTCPDDSQLREYIDISASELTNDTSMITDELLSECCVARKCACKLCHIPSCDNSSMVVYETIPETQIPGRCCGQYECRLEPNCSELHDTEVWLTDCQRCKCVYGQRMCHKSCDEAMPGANEAYCKSKTLNRFFSHGETWRSGCYECECRNGEENCLMPFCRSVNCPQERQVTLKGHCCPVCWPDTGSLPPQDDNDYFDEEEDSTLIATELEDSSPAPIAPVIVVPKPETTSTSTSTSTTTSSTTSSTSTTTQSPSSPPPLPPCLRREDSSASYAVYPEVVEVVHAPSDHNVLYLIIGFETLMLVILSVIIYQLRAKKHSYNTVSNFDDNFNNCQKTSLKIEKNGELI